MRILIIAAIAIATCGTISKRVNATDFLLSGSMDALQAGSNGGFGSFDGGVAGAGNGNGTISGDYDDVTNILNYTLTWDNLTSSITNMHFHLGAPGSSGGIQLGVAGPWSSPLVGTRTLTTTQETNLLAGNWYLNIHTSNFTGGEIRGQVATTAVPEPSSAFAGFLALTAMTVRRYRNS